MATQPAQAQAALAPVEVAKPAVTADPMATLKPILNAHGELDISDLQVGERFAKLQAWKAANPCNAPLMEANLLTIFPAGAGLIPLPYLPSASDAWPLEKITGRKEDIGKVEPSADFLIYAAGFLGIHLEKAFEGEVEIDGKKQWECLYHAYFLTPSGQVMSVMSEGKAQAIYTNSGTIQAHLRESTRKKAKRNAIKALLNIPTSMDVSEFMRPWIFFRPTFKAGVSSETDAIIADQQAIAAQSRKLLYGGSANQASEGHSMGAEAGVTIDITANAPVVADEPSMIEVSEAIERAQTVAELNQIGVDLAEMRLTGTERKQIETLWKARKAKLESPATAPQY